jgi:ectoine hydroxylase-related dioxygenase (phytanoyl-CoA dioxygenase family)
LALLTENIQARGFALVQHSVTPSALESLRQGVQSCLISSQNSNVRNLCARIPEVAQYARSPEVLTLIANLLNAKPRLIRSILFTKSAESNWQILWHQDLAIAVRSRHEVAGYSGWSVKDGIRHVQPPVSVLEQMLTLRLHLDDTDEENGALEVSPGTHKLGRIPADQAADIARSRGTVVCRAKAGELLLMHPLLLHASKKALNDKPRRIIHLEYAACALSPPLEWAEFATEDAQGLTENKLLPV